MKELFGDEYLDYDLVFCHSSGRPMEGQVINRALKKLIQDNDLPDVVFSQLPSRKYNLQAEMERRRYEIGSRRLRTRPNGYGCRCLQPYNRRGQAI